MLILNHIPVLHWGIGGAAIAVITLLLLFTTGKALGISTGFENICALGSRLPYFRRVELRDAWRLPFLIGLVLGGGLSAVLSSPWHLFWDLGLFDQVVGWGPAAKIAWMFIGGLLIGFGTRLAGGCTSGHGIFGFSHVEKASILSTFSFMAAGIITTHLIYRVLFRM